MFISVIIPIYNENKILKKNIIEINNYFSTKYNFEIIAIDDASTDNSLEILKSINIKNLVILKNKVNLGKGFSIIRGIKKTTGNLILVTDADLSAPISEFNQLLKKINEGYDFVIGSRNKKESQVTLKQGIIRIIFGKCFNIIIKIILGLKFNDTQCGFKLFDAEKLKKISSKCYVSRFCIDVEILYLSKLLNINVYEEGIIWNNNKDSSVRIIRDSINMFFDILKIRFRKYK